MLKQKGGSVASDAVTSLVNQDTYSQMNKSFTNQFGDKQCGGKKCCKRCTSCGQKIKRSLKSKRGGGLEDIFKPVTNTAKSFTNTAKSFTTTVTNSASSALGLKSHYANSAFSSQPALAYNAVLPRNAGLKPNATKVTPPVNTKVVAQVAKAKFTNAAPNASAPQNAAIKNALAQNVAMQNSAIQNVAMQNSSLQNTTVTPPVGGKSKRHSKKKALQKKKSSKKLVGGNLKPMSALMSQEESDIYSIRNKRGGAQVGLDYSRIQSSSSVVGPTVDRAMDPIALKIAATQPVNSFPLMHKMTNWGSPLDDGMSFKYSGERVSIPPPSVVNGGSSKKSFVKKAAKTLTKREKKTKK